MKRLVVVALLLAAAHTAMAQPPQEITTGEVIGLRVEQTKTYRFNAAVTKITLSAKDVAEVVPESDRTINIRGVKQGETLMTAYGNDGMVLYRTHIAVLQGGPGRVRIYGQGAPPARGYTGYFCSSVSCSRPDTDVEQSAFSSAISVTRQQPDGSSQTITKEYR